MDYTEIPSLIIKNLPDAHILKSAPSQYVDGFINAFVNVHPENKRAKVLQDRFFIPDASRFNEDQYYQSACELTVANHLKSRQVSAFEVEKKINPPKDVDSYFEAGATLVSVEVKCPSNVENLPQETLVIKMAGRVPNYQQQFDSLRQDLLSVNPTKDVALGKNRDLTLKDYLVSAHEKFSPNSGVDHCNVLFVACGHYFNMGEWYMHLTQNEGLFTAKPFVDPATFRNVDVIILSNLKYFHSAARAFHDWTLNNVFMLAFPNPHGRSTSFGSTIEIALRPFDHHGKAFREYKPVCDDDEDAPPEMLEAVKINHYAARGLSAEDRQRFFPVKLSR